MERKFVVGMPPDVYRRAKDAGARLDINRRAYFEGDCPEEFRRYLMKPNAAVQPPNRRESGGNSAESAVSAIVAARPVEEFAVALDPELQQILAHCDPDDKGQRSAVIADWYGVKIHKLLSRPGSMTNTLSGREWVDRVLKRAELGDPRLSFYAVALARAVKEKQ